MNPPASLRREIENGGRRQPGPSVKARAAYAAAARGVHASEMEEKPTLEKVLHAIDVFYKNADPQANRDEMAEAHTWLMKLQTSVSGRGRRPCEDHVLPGRYKPSSLAGSRVGDRRPTSAA